jgi:hypothetical protein
LSGSWVELATSKEGYSFELIGFKVNDSVNLDAIIEPSQLLLYLILHSKLNLDEEFAHFTNHILLNC